MPFSKLGLSAAVLDGVKAMGYVDPTPIQLRSIPLVLAGRDVIGSCPDWYRKNRRVCPAHFFRNSNATSPLGPRALVLEPNPRTGFAGRNRHPRLFTLPWI